MRKGEKHKPAFVKPKRMFKQKEYQKVLKGKVFGVTLSTGEQRLWHVPRPFTAAQFAKLVRQRLGPFMEGAFPDRRQRTLLLDGEPLLHAPEAKAELARWGVKALPNWPPYSPDMNPQENVWPWIEKNVRKIEARDDTFANFKNKLQRVHSRYPNAESLVASMPKRIAECIERKGAMTKR